MANTNAPKGFKPTKKFDSSPYCGEALPFYIPVTDTVDMFIGDLVDITGTSNTASINGFKAGTLPAVVKATVGATNRILGTIVGFMKPASITDSLSILYGEGTTDRVALVALANNMIFEVQSDGILAATDIGSNFSYVVGDGGSTATGFSSSELDHSTLTQDATFQLSLLRLKNVEKNELGIYAKCEVFINLPRISADIVGV